VLTVHLGDVPKGVPDKTDRWFRWVYPFTPPIWQGAARVTAVSEYTRRLALTYYPVSPQVIPMALTWSGWTLEKSGQEAHHALFSPGDW